MGIHPWTEEEENALMEGMVMHGRSWSKILRDPRFAQHFHKSRNQVKLKDKERCMRLSKSNKNSNSNRSMGKTEAASRRRGMQSRKRKEKEAWTEAVRFWHARLAKHDPAHASSIPHPPSL